MAPLLPIPNSEVKRCIADGSVGFPHVRVGHRQARKKGFVKQGCVTHLKFREEKQEDEEAYNIQDSEEQPKKKRLNMSL